jgi:hypothetical protein
MREEHPVHRGASPYSVTDTRGVDNGHAPIKSEEPLKVSYGSRRPAQVAVTEDHLITPLERRGDMKTESNPVTVRTAQLVRVISALPQRQPLTDAYERSVNRYRLGGREVWYRSQKEHLQGWLDEYGGPGAYGRKNPGQDARFFYNHLRCAAGLMWLAEALGADADQVAAAIEEPGRFRTGISGWFRLPGAARTILVLLRSGFCTRALSGA